jgi:hypothetical protein
VFGDLPVHLLDHLEGGGLLALEAVGVDGVQEVDGELLDQFAKDFDASVEVGFELDGEGAVVHRLREFAPGDLSFGDEDDAAETGAGGVGSHGGGGVACGGAGNPLEATLRGNRERGGHAGVLEGARRVHALMLGEEPVDTGGFGAPGKIVEGGVAFAEGDDFFEVVDDGEQVAEAPDAGLVDGHCGGAALLPEPPESARIGEAAVRAGGSVGPWVQDLVEAAAEWATEVAADRVICDDGSAFGASKVMCCYFHGLY